MDSHIAVLVPALDEEESLPELLRAVPSHAVGTVVVVDNGSGDGTPRVAREAGATVVREPRRGYGSACLAGLRYLESLESPPEVVAFLDADHPEGARALPRLLLPLLEDDADLVLGVRSRPQGGEGNVHVHARLGTRLVLTLVRAFFGWKFRDLPPLRAVRMDSLRRLEMDDRDWGWTLQMQLRARGEGLTVRELPVPHHPRVRGRSKISGSLRVSLKVGMKMMYTLLRERWRLFRRAGERGDA